MSASGQNTVDLDALLDLTEYDAVSNYQSPSLSPSAAPKPTFASPVTPVVTTPSLGSTTQTLSGPSHNYDMYRQQTGFVPGAIANTMAVNQSTNTGYQEFNNMEYLSTFSPENDLFDFNTSPSQNTIGASDIDMEFDSPAESQNFFPTVNPSSIEQDASSLPSPAVVPFKPTSTVIRFFSLQVPTGSIRPWGVSLFNTSFASHSHRLFDWPGLAFRRHASFSISIPAALPPLHAFHSAGLAAFHSTASAPHTRLN